MESSMFQGISGTYRNINFMFNEKCVFITGATGFLGKVLLEKLIRSCPTLSKVLVLIRRNEKYTSEERLQKLFESNVFDRIKSECPDIVNKVHAIDGDVTEVDFALNAEDKNTLLSDVHYVFHCAASVRFENNSRNTLKINFLGVKNMLNLCHEMKNLSAVIHVSTAYSFCNQGVISEQLYDEEIKVCDLEKTIEEFDDKSLDMACQKMAKSRPSLYQYSKAMAEIYIAKNCGELPVVIVRPSIITAAAKEPFPGWIDNYNGPSGFIALSSKGLIKTLQVNPTVNADWVPVDHVANTLIVAAYHKAMVDQYPKAFLLPLFKKSDVPIVNCVCPHANAIKWSSVVQICIPLLRKYPSMHVYRVPGGVVTSSKCLHVLCRYFYHYLPAAILDAAVFLMWKERRFVRNYQRIHKVLNFLQHYTMNEFRFKTGNMSILIESVHDTDRSTFPIDQNLLNWRQYLEDYVLGVRRFFLKEDDSSLLQAQKRLARVQMLEFWGKVTPVALILLLVLKRRNGIPISLALAKFGAIIWKPFDKISWRV
ncbi:fatty acyl-CoA reductase 1 isoform X1 [Parasteatoda tepidariorum]|uniref:fatty acyl-CoA reductase 1 isoform X1 n=2 Tax=Parasteatoda tepidariorum TaxID=114398 RepID=UPI001C7199A4|nr:fatty acyl-CoA reductase 1 [Parasteatoda tepidariorum]